MTTEDIRHVCLMQLPVPWLSYLGEKSKWLLILADTAHVPFVLHFTRACSKGEKNQIATSFST